jgi:hypothetical protein
MRKTTAETFVSGILSKILNSLPSVPEILTRKALVAGVPKLKRGFSCGIV